jgi:hypothetical protein
VARGRLAARHGDKVSRARAQSTARQSSEQRGYGLGGAQGRRGSGGEDGADGLAGGVSICIKL